MEVGARAVARAVCAALELKLRPTSSRGRPQTRPSLVIVFVVVVGEAAEAAAESFVKAGFEVDDAASRSWPADNLFE
jgi:hypothetical protein